MSVAEAIRVTDPVPATCERDTNRNADPRRTLLDVRLAAEELGLGWPTDNEILDHAAARVWWLPLKDGGYTDTRFEGRASCLEALGRAVENVVKKYGPMSPPDFDDWPDYVKQLATAFRGPGWVRTVVDLAAEVGDRGLSVRNEVRRLQRASCWCWWGNHPIDETAAVAFVKGGVGEQRQTRQIACVDCYDQAAAARLVTVRENINAGQYHESWKAFDDDRLRQRWVEPDLLHNGSVWWNGSIVTRRPDTSPCLRCGRGILHAKGSGYSRRWYGEPTASGYAFIAFVCSDRCRGRLRAAERAVEPQARDCGNCGESFTPARRDARYCSSACRQFAYRQRKAGR